MASKLLIYLHLYFINKMNNDVFLMLKTDTQDVLFLLYSLRKYYIKNRYRLAVKKVNDSIITSSVSLLIIDKMLTGINQ